LDDVIPHLLRYCC